MKQKDAKSLAKFRQKLVDLAAKVNGVFVHYDGETWIMKVDKF